MVGILLSIHHLLLTAILQTHGEQEGNKTQKNYLIHPGSQNRWQEQNSNAENLILVAPFLATMGDCSLPICLHMEETQY